MKILCIADSEDERLISSWSTVGKARLEGVELILSAGDLKPYYLEFLVTMLNVPCLYVRGNHDMMYHDDPPLGSEYGNRAPAVGNIDTNCEHVESSRCVTTMAFRLYPSPILSVR